MIVFGGVPGDDSVYTLRLSPAGWESSDNTGGTPQIPREYHTAVYDPEGNRMLVFGGQHGSGFYLNDLWAYNFTPGPGFGWQMLSPTGPLPSPRSFHAAIYDSVTSAMLTFGGYSVEWDEEVMSLQIPRTTSVPFADWGMNVADNVRVIPNPSLGRTTFEFEAGAVESQRVTVVDLQGRLVWESEVVPNAAGRTSIVWNGRWLDGARVVPGVYFLRLGETQRKGVRFAVLN